MLQPTTSTMIHKRGFHMSYLLLRSISLAAVIAMPATAAHVHAQAPLKCRPADATSAGIIAELKQWVTTTNPDYISQRDNIFHVPVVSVNSMTVVTDEKVCGKVIQAYGTFPTHPYVPTRLYVIKLGSKGYGGYDPDRKGGEFTAVHIFSTKFVRIGGWVG